MARNLGGDPRDCRQAVGHVAEASASCGAALAQFCELAGNTVLVRHNIDRMTLGSIVTESRRMLTLLQDGVLGKGIDLDGGTANAIRTTLDGIAWLVPFRNAVIHARWLPDMESEDGVLLGSDQLSMSGKFRESNLETLGRIANLFETVSDAMFEASFEASRLWTASPHKSLAHHPAAPLHVEPARPEFARAHARAAEEVARARALKAPHWLWLEQPFEHRF